MHRILKVTAHKITSSHLPRRVQDGHKPYSSIRSYHWPITLLRHSPITLRHSIYTVAAHVHVHLYCEKCSCTNSTSSIKVILVWHYDQNDKMYMYAVSTLGVCRVWSDTVTSKHPPPGLVHAQYAFPGANTVVYSLAAQKAKCNWCDKKRMTSLW